jgi:hypothetical protein
VPTGEPSGSVAVPASLSPGSSVATTPAAQPTPAPAAQTSSVPAAAQPASSLASCQGPLT